MYQPLYSSISAADAAPNEAHGAQKKRHELSINLQFDQKKDGSDEARARHEVEPIVENSLENFPTFEQPWLAQQQIQEWDDSGYSDQIIKNLKKKSIKQKDNKVSLK